MTRKTYRVTFERVGRNHSVAPLVARAADADELAARVHNYARQHLRSRDYEVVVELDKGTGYIAAGMHNAGEFKIEEVS